MSFDGSNDAVYLGSIDVTGSAISLAAWIKADDFGTYDARIISKANGVNDADHWWMLSTIGDGSGLRFRLKTNGTTHTLISSNGVIAAGQWRHVAAVYDGSAMRLYRDGIEVASMSKTGPLSTSAAVLAAIGNNPAGVGERPFDGRIDDVRIYNTALDTADLAALIAGGAPNAAPMVIAGPDQTVIGMVAALSGAVVNDDLPSPPGSVSARWVQVAGPSAAAFADPLAASTNVAATVAGQYTFRLIADDGQVKTASEVTVVFGPATNPADFDADGDVDLDDFVTLKKHFGTAGNTSATGDTNGDGLVDLDDFVIFKQNFGALS